ncbi:MAG: hypothetical protein ACRDXX_18940 [Stackebrandtia sp.]
MRIAVTGPRDLYDAAADKVKHALRDELRQLADGDRITGVSCLADGADQFFADAVLELGGRLEVVVPAAEYRDGLPEAAHAGYDRLFAVAAHVRRLDHRESTEQSHMDASVAMLDGADRLVAIWDGQPARGYGGTADVVDYAREHDIAVTVVWPEGARRGR